jgi:flagellar biosynthetic protein FlhB
VSEEAGGEKPFDPTPKRKRDAALKGDVLRSREVATAAAVVAGGIALTLIGSWLVEALHAVALEGFAFDREDLEQGQHFARVRTAAGALLPPVLAIGLAVLIVTAGSQLLLGEGRWVTKNAGPKASRINPLSGLKRIFGVQGLIELGKSILKLTLLGGIAFYWATVRIGEVFAMGASPVEAQLALALPLAFELGALVAGGLIVIAIVDYPLQAFQRTKRLRMSHQELREETKQTEGSPQVKAARRQRQRDLARGGVAVAMAEAQFLIVNPMHFAVALAYDPKLAPAPVVLAKGRSETAMAMREIAGENDLPVLEYPALARAVYFTTRANQMVREELYVATAALVAFVMGLKRGENPPRPHVEVPAELRFDAEGRHMAP